MMERIRTATQRITVKIIFLLIILSFIFTGLAGIIGSRSDANQKYIAKINGQGLSRAAYEEAVRIEIEKNHLYQSAEIAALRQRILDEQIKNQLLSNFADNIGLSISDEQIKGYIVNQPSFFENGSFDNDRYLQILAANGLTPDSYAEWLRTVLKQQQLAQVLFYSDFILPIEEEQHDQLLGQERTFRMASISVNDFDIKNRDFDESTLRAYYQAHLDRFTVNDDSVKLAFVRLPRSDIEKRIKVSRNQLNNYFKENSIRYKAPGQIAYRVIETDKEELANAIYTKLLAGESFVKLASKYAYYPSQHKNKGFLGWFNEDEVPTVFRRANLKNRGDFSGPLKQEDGHYLIIRLDNKRNQTVPPLASIEQRVRMDLISALTNQQLRTSELEMKKMVAQGMTLDKIAKKMALKKELSGWVTPHDIPFSHSVIAQLVMSAISDNDYNQLLGPVYVAQTADLYLLKLIDYRPAGQLGFEDVKKEILVLLQNDDKQASFHKAATKLVERFNRSPAELQTTIKFSDRETVQRDNKKFDKRLVDALFAIVPATNDSSVYSVVPLDHQQGAIISLLKVKQNSKGGIRDTLFSQWLRATQYSLIDILFSEARIKLLTNN